MNRPRPLLRPFRQPLALFCLTLMQAGCGTTATPSATFSAVPFEHYDPAYLNQEAIAALAAGDRGTALILLERAALLAPADALVRENLAALKTGGALRKKAAAAAPSAETVPAPSEPAIWPPQ
jgi:Flp pilus assembly protein TadD